jgi:hypothetical protein
MIIYIVLFLAAKGKSSCVQLNFIYINEVKFIELKIIT